MKDPVGAAVPVPDIDGVNVIVAELEDVTVFGAVFDGVGVHVSVRV